MAVVDLVISARSKELTIKGKLRAVNDKLK